MKIIAIANQKGGCGKTTTSVNLAAALADKGQRILVVDLDPQGHATIGFGYNPDAMQKTIYDVLVNPQLNIDQTIISTNVENLDLSPSNILLSGAEIELSQLTKRELVLTEKLKTVSDKYDICVIDCPPSLGMLTLNALVASTDVVVPVQAHYYAMEGLKQLFETAQIIREQFQPCSVKIMGLLLTFVERNTIFCRQIVRQMREYFGQLVFDTMIHKTVRLAEAPSAGQSVLTYAPSSSAATEYQSLAEEILEKLGLQEKHQQDLQLQKDHINV